MSTLLEIFAPSFILRDALYEALILGLVCPCLGLFFVLRRMVFLGVTLPQAASCGVALSFLISGGILGAHAHGSLSERDTALIGAILFSFVGIVILAVREGSKSVGVENKIGILYAASGAMTLLALSLDPHGEAQMIALLKGDILATTTETLLMTLIFGVTMIGVIFFARRPFFSLATDREFALSQGLSARRWDFIFYTLSAVCVGYGVYVAGPLVVFGLMILPPLVALKLVRGMGRCSVLSSVIGGASALLGFIASYRLDLPFGPSICMVALIAFFVLSVALRVRVLR